LDRPSGLDVHHLWRSGGARFVSLASRAPQSEQAGKRAGRQAGRQAGK
jgi:hypothetical protein